MVRISASLQMELDDDVVEGEDNAGDAAKAFDAALDASDLDPEAALGKVRLLRREGDHEDALSMLADLVVRYPWLVPAEVSRDDALSVLTDVVVRCLWLMYITWT